MRRRAHAVRWVEPPPTLPTAGARIGTAPAGAAPTGAAPTGAAPTGTAPAGAPAEPGSPGELPDDVLATDAGLTELPEPAADEVLADTVDETRVAELLAESPDAEVVVVDEATYEQAVADAAPEPPAAAEPASSAGAEAAEAVAIGPEVAEPAQGTSEARLEDEPAGAAADDGADATSEASASRDEPTERRPAAPGVEEPTVSIQLELDDDPGSEIPMPTVSEAPTGEIPAVTDDLRAVRGIGRSMESRLHGLGIVSYRQLAMLDGEGLERVRAELADFRSRIEREDWVGQARELHRQKYGRDPS
jgi:predicted flap endonuclease-1-like 5' DNA nuclease